MDQSWHNPRSKWRRKFFWRSLGPLAGGVAQVVVAGFILWSLVMMMQPVGVPTFRAVSLFFLGAALIFLFIAGLFFHAFVRLLRLKRMILETDGSVCPWCRIVVPGGDGGGGVCRCDRCGSEHPPADIRQYWATFALNPYEAHRWLEEHHPRRDRWWRRWMRSMKPPTENERIRWPWVVVSMLPVVVIAGMIWWSTRNPIVVMIVGALMVAACAGWMHVARRMQPKREQSRFCASCDYQLAPGENAGERCPECAAVWTAPGAVYSGRRMEMNKLMLANLAIAAVVWFVIFGGMPWLNTSRLSSDGALMKKVVGGSGFLYEEWAELNVRELSPELVAQLGQGLLDRRERRHTLERGAYAWTIARIADESLSPQFAEEFYAGIIKARLLGPERATVGEEVTIGIENINRYQDPLIGAPQPAVIVSGFEVGDDPTPHHRATQPASIVSFGTRIYSYGQMQSGYDGMGPALKIVPQKPGTLKIRVRYWILGVDMMAGSWGSPVLWNEDGTPVLPVGTDWAYERLLEHEVRVE